MGEMLSNASLVAKLSLMVPLVPMVMGILYAIRPNEARLALMRPLSLAGIFSALAGFSTGLINVLVGASRYPETWANGSTLVGLAESAVSLLVGFGCLTVAWLCVAIGLRRQTVMM